MLHPTPINFRLQRQDPAKHKRMYANPYNVQGSSAQHSNLHQHDRSARSLHLPYSGTFQPRDLQTSGQQMTGSATSSSFSRTGGLHMEDNPAHLSDSVSAYRLRHPNLNGMKKNHTGLHQDLESDFALDRDLIDESRHNSLPVTQDVSTSQELSWRQHDHFSIDHQLSTSADTDYGLCGLDFFGNDSPWSPNFVQDPVLGFADSHTLDHPGAIKIGGSSGHYKPGLPSSFPPSADCFPDYMPTMQNQVVTSNSEPTFLPSSPPKLPFRRNSNKSTSTRASRSGSLSIIREYGYPQHGSPNLSRNGSGKGKRKGPLPTATALAAAQKRKDGSVCIRCRTMKMTVGRCGRMLSKLANRIVV